MQMWSCGLSCRTNRTNLLASFHILSRTYTNTAVVHIFCHQTVSDWLDVDAEKLQGTVKELPSREQIAVPVA